MGRSKILKPKTHLLACRIDLSWEQAIAAASAYYEESESEFLRGAIVGYLLTKYEKAIGYRKSDGSLAEKMQALFDSGGWNKTDFLPKTKDEYFALLTDYKRKASAADREVKSLYSILLGLGCSEGTLIEYENALSKE